MIVYPKNWHIDYEKFALSEGHVDVDIPNIIDILYGVLKKINVNCLAYSGGVDSTIVLCLLTRIFDNVFTYTISSREDHPDMQFAKYGSTIYNSTHREFIVDPTHEETDKFTGDNAIRQLFELIETNEIICCDGIDEFMCGYYAHQDLKHETYRYFLSRLLSGHLIPLDNNSKDTKVFIPYLDNDLVNIFKHISLSEKVNPTIRKKIVCSMARYLEIPEKIITRNKYGFCDAFIENNK